MTALNIEHIATGRETLIIVAMMVEGIHGIERKIHQEVKGCMREKSQFCFAGSFNSFLQAMLI